MRERRAATSVAGGCSVVTLLDDLRSTDRETVYDAIISAGKEDRRELLAMIEPFLATPDAGLREAALKTLGFYWGLQAHRTHARLALMNDPDVEVRVAATMALSTLASGPGDDLSLLVAVALAPAEDEWVRDAAYSAALFVAGIPRRDFPLDSRVPGFDTAADWKLLLHWMQRAGAPIPDRLGELAGRDVP